MGKGIARQKPLADVTLFEQGVVCINLVCTLLAEPDVKYFQLSDELLVLCEEEREFLMLERERHVSTDDIGADIIGIVLSHQSGRNVDADDFRG